MTELIVIYAVKNYKEPVKKEWLKTEITLTFEGLEAIIRYYVWSVLGGSFMGGW